MRHRHARDITAPLIGLGGPPSDVPGGLPLVQRIAAPQPRVLQRLEQRRVGSLSVLASGRGPGAGLSSEHVRRAFPGCRVTGVDLSPHMVAVGRYLQEQRLVTPTSPPLSPHTHDPSMNPSCAQNHRAFKHAPDCASIPAPQCSAYTRLLAAAAAIYSVSSKPAQQLKLEHQAEEPVLGRTLFAQSTECPTPFLLCEAD